MANPGTLYRFRIGLSDVDRAVYDAIDFRVQMHPSEAESYLLTRVLAYALNFESGLEFLPGLCTGDEPALRLPGPNGETLKWIEIGNPTARRLHKAAKAARSVKVYTYKDPENLRSECAGERIHRAEEVEIYALDRSFLDGLASTLRRDNEWSVIHNGGELVVSVGGETFMGTLARYSL